MSDATVRARSLASFLLQFRIPPLGGAIYPWLGSVTCNVVPPTAKARSELW